MPGDGQRTTTCRVRQDGWLRPRDFHRRALTIHFVLWMLLLVAAFLVNRRYTPDTFWLPWVGLAAAVALAIHGAIFARETLSTMGGYDR